MSVLSDRIRQEREYINFPPERMAAELGITADEYAAFESGQAAPTDGELSTIAYLCGTTPARLHGEELRADPRLEQVMAGKDLTHDDVYEVHRFAELLRVRAAADQSGEAS